MKVFLPLIANASFISIKCFVGKAFRVFVNSYIRLRSDRCIIKDNLHKLVDMSSSTCREF